MIDRQASHRWNRIDIAEMLNLASRSIVRDRIDNIKKNNNYSFESYEIIRQELHSLVIPDRLIPVFNNTFNVPLDFYMEILTYGITSTGKRVLITTKTFAENDLSNNSFTNPTIEYPVMRRSKDGYTIDSGTNSFTSVSMSYIKKLNLIKIGNNDIVPGDILVAGKNYAVENDSIIYNGVTYEPEDTFVGSGGTFTGNGILFNFEDNDMPDHTDDEICKKASEMLTGSQENYNKSQFLQGKVEDN